MIQESTKSQNKMTGYPSIDQPWLKYYKKELMKKP